MPYICIKQYYMKEIKLSNSEKVVIVDDEDFEELSKYEWVISNGRTNMGYANRRGPSKFIYVGPNQLRVKVSTTIIMHRQLMNAPDNMKRSMPMIRLPLKPETRFII